MTAKKIIMVCETCGCADVTADACATWDFAAQEWCNVTVYDNSDCEKCGSETHIKEKEVDPARLFNCQPDNDMPDWSTFKHIEVGGCIDDPQSPGNTIGLQDDDKAEFWTVYGRQHEGEAEAITDCETRAEADEIAAEIAALAGLKVEA